MRHDVRLTPMSDDLVEPLLSAAVAEAEPGEVMPPVPGPAGWTAARRDAFREFHRAHFGGGHFGPAGTIMYAVTLGGDVVGGVRLTRLDAPSGVVETGIWLGRSARGRGIGAAALRAVLDEAVRLGAQLVVARTTPANRAAINLLRRCGAIIQVEQGQVRARFWLDEAFSTDLAG
ncbi:GNAT family N-acetyltransferase [Solwaraspora sp. WMMA2056]|uniref:GNAT family N-acetyltransferase n=1 Tax=Solwaraspora sp. WMMA2056 TaxID=3015161 RepID=UPI00259B4456|nr:GNAT family N-acetyltransferase [Solwaraspora sp. WMMA2056]WJK43779.1 GNAT family N-acetyltransferase [Solwaraspora sp. WMMA2056]